MTHTKKHVLVIGGGGREHALCWHLKAHGHRVSAAPGSDAIRELAETFSFRDFPQLISEIQSRQIDQVIIGPEKYLAEGIADSLEAAHIPVFGPTQQAAQLESDKAWAKKFCARHGVPTARSEILVPSQSTQISATLKKFRAPFVVKASGLAQGKGVWIGSDPEEAIRFGESALKNHHSIVIEEFLPGEEVSFFILIDGAHSLFLGAAQDHKRLLENDEGPNTGGMGAYSPIPLVTEDLKSRIEAEVVAPIMKGLSAEGIHYRGFLFLGLMISGNQPYLLEFNCRMGDPETQALMLKLDEDLLELLSRLHTGHTADARQKPGVALNVVLAATGYPDHPKSGFELSGLESPPPHVMIFHAGTERARENGWRAKGGRLISVATLAPSLYDAQMRIYPFIETFGFLSNMTYRRDIGVKAYRHLRGVVHG